MMSLIVFLGIAGLFLPVTGHSSGPAPHGFQTYDVPSDWYRLPEDEPALSQSLHRAEPETTTLPQTLEKIYSVTAQSMDQLPHALRPTRPSPPSRPQDWVPWHLESFTTDLTVTGQGLLGILTIRGTPTVQVFWRKQGSLRPSTPRGTSEPTGVPLIQLNEETTEEQIHDQIEPAIQAVTATGKVRNTSTLRKSLQATAQQFQAILAAVDQNRKSAWWLSGFRFDFGVEASGDIAPIFTAGGDLRLRFEWKRLNRSVPVPRGSVKLNPTFLKMRSSFNELVVFMESNLEGMSKTYLGEAGFIPYAFRVGIGLTAGGNIGLARGAGSVVGHLNFSKDIQRPMIHRPYLITAAAPVNAPSSVRMVEQNPTESHLDFADVSHIPNRVVFLRSGRPEKQAIYQIQSERFQKGLVKAFKIASSFAKPASKLTSSKWKVYEMRTGFELSIAGDVGLVNLNGVAVVEASLYNERF